MNGSEKYDQGEWRERKVGSDRWNISYQTVRRKTDMAPEDSGTPMGTEYNWLIVAHQKEVKTDHNSYMSSMEGVKFKIAHKSAGKQQYNISEKTQRKRVINYLENLLTELRAVDENESIPYTVDKKERIYGLEHFNRDELYKLAKERNIPNRSKMKRQELFEAVKENMNGDLIEKSERPVATIVGKLTDKKREDLYEIASERDIPGRSEMKKQELLEAVKHDLIKRRNRVGS